MIATAPIACGCFYGTLPKQQSPRRDEARFRRSVLSRLEPHFHVTEEVPGRHPSGRRLVIDAILRPRDSRRWRNPDVSLGVEFKDEIRLRGLADINGWFAQCLDYSQCAFARSFGREVFIFACPSLLDQVDGAERAVLASLMSKAGIGELRLDWSRGWTFVLGERELWSEVDGVLEGRRMALGRKVGSR